jgi:endonuclease YncB( thermonuclease family)
LPAIVVGLLGARAVWVFAVRDSPAPLVEGVHHVEQVVDGGTLIIEPGRRVRLQGIDTPRPPEAARALAERFVEQAGGVVLLRFLDERIDEDGNYLAFVYDGDRCLNVEMLREGLARARLEYRHSGVLRTKLKNAQAEAREAGAGIWED